MRTNPLSLSQEDVSKLLATTSGDAALLYLYIHAGNEPEQAESDLNMTHSRYSCASATLRQLGLWLQPARALIPTGERPNYSEQDVMEAMDGDLNFRLLFGEVQRVLGKALNTEELKILLGFTRYLGLSPDVICVLVNYCKDRQRQRGSNRSPSLRSIEKEAYQWAERGIDTIEEAAAYIQTRNTHNARMYHIRQLLQIRGRWLTAAEENYATQWLDMGFDDQALLMAYERTCLNTGALKWPYMNSILQRWHKQGLHTAEQITAGDRKPEVKDRRELDSDELAAIARMMNDEEEKPWHTAPK